MFPRTEVLDRGYLELIERWGSDERIIEAARMSTAKGFLGWGELRCRCGATSTTARWDGDGKISRLFHDAVRSYCPIERGGAHVAIEGSEPGDEKLLRYLWTHKHHTPFEMAGATIEVQAPIFVFREWHRHRTASYNELSSRYTPLPDLNYVPSVERLLQVGGKNKQAASTGAILDTVGAETFRERLAESHRTAERLYRTALDNGVPKELARLCVPVARYSRMRASANLRNWLGFLTLRMDAAAQWEIRQYANALHDVLAQVFPRTLALFDEGRGRARD
jgi:thymidylate synthase (FAD)